MINIAKASNEEREVLFSNAAQRAGIDNPAIVEKDFWVTLVLDYISNVPAVIWQSGGCGSK